LKTRLLAAAALFALAGCPSSSTPPTGAAFTEPSAVAVFRGVTIKSGLDPTNPVYPYHPYLVVANAGGNNLGLFDAVDDTVVQAPAPLHGLVYPVPGRPLRVVSGDLGDRKPDLLAVVTAGDLPWLGGASLELIRTWAADGAVVGSVPLDGDVLAITALPFDPSAPGAVQLVAALADERIAVVTFRRSTAGDGTAVDVAGAQVVTSAPLGFQPIELAVLPGDRTRVFAASVERLPDGVLGVAEISLVGTPAFVAGLNALAPTRLVGAARLAEADLLRDLSSPAASALDASAFVDATTSLPRPVVDRVYAVLDESSCGLRAPIACGLVALDPVTRTLLPDPTPVGTTRAPYLAPLQLATPVALGVTGPPVNPPSLGEPQYAGTYLRIAADAGARQSTAAGGLASVDGSLSFVDLARWDIPSQQAIRTNVKATVTLSRPTNTGTQWLVLARADGGAVHHTDTAGLAAAVTLTPGYTPSDHWVVTQEGILPGLSELGAEAANDGTPWLALQQTAADGSVQGAVRLWDPTLGVRIDDIVVIEPTGLGTCATFEARVADVVPPDATRPGGYVRLAHRTISPANAEWNRCVDAIPAASASGRGPFFKATFRAGGYVLVRGATPIHVGRPQLGSQFGVTWRPEDPFTNPADPASCPLPPAAAWPAAPPACDAACRDRCMDLQRVRLARRVSYVAEAPADATGTALTFTLALEVPTAPVPRDFALVIDTNDGRAPFRVGASTGSPVDPRAVTQFDRSPWDGGSGVRFLVPYAGGIVVDGTPTRSGGSVNTMH
jgi:hypothetical protein